MEMEVTHLLSGVGPAIEYEPVAVGEVLIFSDLPRHHEKMTDETGVFGFDLVVSGYGLSRDNEHMNGSDGANVSDGKAPVILVHEIARDLPVFNLLKQCLLRHG